MALAGAQTTRSLLQSLAELAPEQRIGVGFVTDSMLVNSGAVWEKRRQNPVGAIVALVAA